MKNNILFVIIVSILSCSPFFAQENNFNFLPDSLSFMPLKANHQEARIGVLYYPKNGYLKVDIGNNIDLLKFRIDSKSYLAVGIEFMAYALSTNYQGRRLQIDALDGFFGGHASYESSTTSGKFKSRFRIIHNSAHLVDGHYDLINFKWKNDINPIPFTQDFGEITSGYESLLNSGKLFYYGSIGYSTLVRPSLIKKYFFSAGFEFSNNKIIGPVFGRETNLFIASHNRLVGMPEYKISTSNMAGIKFGDWYGKGIVFYLSYFYGNDQLSEYYYRIGSKYGLGFFIDFI